MGVNDEGPHRVPSLRVTPIFGHWEQDAQEREGGGGKSLHRTAVLESDLLHICHLPAGSHETF